MNTHSIITWPLVGISYALAAVGCAAWAVTRRADKIPWSLSGLIFVIALLNAYVEEEAAFRWLRFDYALSVLVVLFVITYRSFCLRLIERTGLRPALLKEQYSGLLPTYALFAGVAAVVAMEGHRSDPAFGLFAFLVFVCVLHVPIFAFGRGKIARFLVNSGFVLSKAVPDILGGSFATVAVILGIPLIVALAGRVILQDDYRLFAVDAVLTIVIFSLLGISRRGEFN